MARRLARSLVKLQKYAAAGNRTQINCLEGNYANRYTTAALEISWPNCSISTFRAGRNRRANRHVYNHLGQSLVYVHITLKTPVLVRTPKLSNVEPG